MNRRTFIELLAVALVLPPPKRVRTYSFGPNPRKFALPPIFSPVANTSWKPPHALVVAGFGLGYVLIDGHDRVRGFAS